MVANKCSLPQTIKKWIIVVKLMEIKFSIFLNFFDVFLIFFRCFFDVFFLCFVFLYFCFSMFCRSMFRHRSDEKAHNEPSHLDQLCLQIQLLLCLALYKLKQYTVVYMLMNRYYTVKWKFFASSNFRGILQ